MIIRKAIYGLRTSGAAFRSKLADLLHEYNYRPSEADPNVWISPSVDH